MSKFANDKEVLYNTANERECDINENSRRTQQDDKRRVQELLEKYTRGKETTSTSEKNIFGKQKREYKKKITNARKEIINKAKSSQKS